ncbi:hypothetical protein ACJ41O_008923 [Fusarium nematophilum]
MGDGGRIWLSGSSAVGAALPHSGSLKRRMDKEQALDRFKETLWDTLIIFGNIAVMYGGFGEWLLRHETYTSWASCSRGLLWIKGKPGAGKSTLLRHALDNVMEMPGIGEDAIILSFFFHGRGTELQRTPLGLFRSLLYQLREVPVALLRLVATFQKRRKAMGKSDEKW